jgi:hypothetical protein
VFPSGSNSLCTMPRESKKIINMVLMQDLWNFSFFSWGDVSPNHSALCRFILGSQAKHQVSSPVIILLKRFLFASAITICLGKMWLNLPFAQLSRSVQQHMHTTFSVPNPLSKCEELQSWGCSRILLSFLMWFSCHFWPNQQQQQCLPQCELILDGHLSGHLLAASFHLEIENTT